MTGELPESSIPDEAWEEFQRESEGPARLAAPKEPSARARMVAERLRREDEKAARRQGRGRRWGRKRRAEVRAEPDGWRAWPTHQQTRAPRRRGRGIFWVLVAIGVVMLVMNPEKVLSWLS
ncbi:hypothetical protein OG883_09425 [Streptomyces sp. NBC_01142]|uniref:hypothetical protein n=1 Tax=Streptomyces sp. NBC_01142 TaxID=2975865 RepID=UPI002257B588|nr:hypothetical protein [Streptomyces sp. NBC_01142]MCX4820121.1 hypothetical protein [Streptomyces sp. NBC_01142]